MARQPAKAPKARNAARDNPSTPSLAYQAAVGRWNLINACLGGTESMRAAGQALMPKHEGEAQKKYDERLASAVFTNFTRLTLDFLVGKPYSKEVEFRENTPQSLLDIQSDIDLQGNDVTVVTKNFFWQGLGKGWSYLMVEYPQQDETEITLAEAAAKNLRPYWVVLQPEVVISEFQMRIDGKDTFTHLRIWGSETQRDGYAEVIVNRIYEYNLVSMIDPETNKPVDGKYQVLVDTWRQKAKNSKEFIPDAPRRVLRGMDRIPVVKFQTNAEGRPELLDEAYLNVRHWQSSADQNSCLTMARFPILAGSGVDEDDNRIIGPYELLVTSDPTAKFYYVENTGIAIGVGSSDIASLEDKMAMYGAELLKKRPGRETATARTLDETQSMAPLQIIVLTFMSCLEQVCDYTLRWLSDPAAENDQTYGIDVNLDFALSDEQQKQMSFFENARLQGDISRKKFLQAGKDLGFIPQDFNMVENEAEIQVEVVDDMKRQAAVAALAKAQTAAPAGPAGGNTGEPGDNPNIRADKLRPANVPAV